MTEECEHEQIEVGVAFNRLRDGEDGPIVGYAADFKIICQSCKIPFRFVGLPMGHNPNHPTVSADLTELRAPMRLASSVERIKPRDLPPLSERFPGPV